MITRLLLLIGVLEAFTSAQYSDSSSITTTTTQYPIVNENSRISEKKCLEYSRAMYETIDSLPLTGSKPMVIDKCDQKTESLIMTMSARPREFPHMALIGYDNDDHSSEGDNRITWMCSGNLISDQHILVAAHCLENRFRPQLKYVRLGELDILSHKENDQRKDFNITDIFVHPNFKRNSKYNDIGIIKLERKVKLNPYRRPACLPTSSEIPEKQELISTGWERSTEGDSSFLQKMIMDHVGNQKCNASYGIERRLPQGIVDDTQICTEPKSKPLGCSSYSGGTLQVDNPTVYCMHTIIGIPSFGYPCVGTHPDVSTRVYPYLDWIESIVWG